MRVAVCLAMLAVAIGAEAQEYWHFGSPMRMYGVYRRKYANPSTLYAAGNGEQSYNTAALFNLNSKNSYYEEARANISITVQDVVYDGKSAKRYVSDWDDLPIREDELKKLNANQKLEVILNVSHRHVETVVDAEGNPRLVYSRFKDGRGQVQVWARFNKDDIDLTVETKQGTKKLTINPAYGVEAFANPIPALLALGDKDREAHRYSTLDPKTGGVINYMVQYKTKFKGTIDRVTYSGFVYELAGPEGKRYLLVSEKGELVQVDFGNDRDFINAVITTDLGKPPP